MVLINIESLSDNELRNIAKQEDLEDWDTLSREELIEELEDFYDEDDGTLPEIHSGSSRRKFVNTLTDVQSDNVLSLPGTEPLPESYNETSIHMILKDMDWAYVFWSLSTQQLAEIEETGANLVLRTIRSTESGEEVASYDIDVSISDDNWTVELPHKGYNYQACLIMVNGSEQKTLCRSTVIATKKSWISSHPMELRDDVTFRTLLSSLVLKGGTMTSNKQVEDLLADLEDDGTEAEVAR